MEQLAIAGINLEQLLQNLGPWAFWVSALIIFAECGLLIGFFLPGDSLLFIVGLLIAQGFIPLNIVVAIVILSAAAILGNLVGYWIGSKIGPPLFNRPDSRLFKKEYVTRTHAFFQKYGASAVFLGRFVPIVRTFITAIAGVAGMDFRKYAFFSTLGGIAWVALVTLLGFFLGNVPFVENNLEIMLLLVVVVSVIPIIIEYLRSRGRDQTDSAESAAPTDG